ncbi:FG-GAP repeat protein [bacterium]|nr:FG-GAP repeat protein [bacterium]
MHIPSNTIKPIYNPDGNGTEYFGLSVAIDGDKFVVGAQGANAGKGRAYVYDTNTLSLLHTIDNPNNSTGDAFANAIDISDNQIIVGNYLEDETGVTDSGKVFIFDALTGNHTRTIDNINADGSGDSDHFGYSVAVSNEKLIVGARYEDDADGSNSGKSYIFTSL